MAVATCQCGQGFFAIGRASAHSCKLAHLFQTTSSDVFTESQEAAEVIVVTCAVVGFQAVVLNGRAVVIEQDIMCGVEGEHFITRFDNPGQFVVLEPGRSRPLVGTVSQVS